MRNLEMRKPSRSSENVLGAAAIRRTRVATCAVKAPTKMTTSSQSRKVDIYEKDASTENTKDTKDATDASARMRRRQGRVYALSAAVSAGTTSNRSPTMP